MSIAIHWFRRDLRVTDNTALTAAVSRHESVVPAYIVSEWKERHRWTGAPRQEFLCGCIASLAANLKSKGGRLIIRRQDADKALEKLVRETGAEAIYYNRDPDPYGRAMEKRIESASRRLGVAVHAHKDHALHEREEILTGADEPFRVFTPYARAWSKLEKAKPGRAISRLRTPPEISSEPLPTLSTWRLASGAEILQPGESAARRRLSRFLDGPIFSYGGLRDIPASEGTSRLSQDLRHGTLSIREIFSKCREVSETATATQRRSIEIFINELIWREFYFQALWHWPELLEREFLPERRGMQWASGGEPLERWREGQTGFPIVDAGMRQLNATGFMHNRVRMIVAMFLTKDLHIDWRSGEQWFMQRLVDGEIASNNGGWQWSASTGADAAPYFRIQNPWLQTRRYDPDGDYIKRWVPELRDVPAVKFAAPPTPGLALAKGYPHPVVDHAVERDRALEMYRT
jgi:deoxyribodipyrimidine photo-lyase